MESAQETNALLAAIVAIAGQPLQHCQPSSVFFFFLPTQGRGRAQFRGILAFVVGTSGPGPLIATGNFLSWPSWLT